MAVFSYDRAQLATHLPVSLGIVIAYLVPGFVTICTSEQIFPGLTDTIARSLDGAIHRTSADFPLSRHDEDWQAGGQW